MKHPLTDDQLVGSALRTLASQIDEQFAAHPVPAASTVWFRAQRERRRLALQRAMRPLRIMQTLALLCPILIAALLLHQYSRSAAQLLTPALLAWAALALLTAIAGLLAMLHLSRQPSPSRP